MARPDVTREAIFETSNFEVNTEARRVVKAAGGKRRFSSSMKRVANTSVTVLGVREGVWNDSPEFNFIDIDQQQAEALKILPSDCAPTRGFSAGVTRPDRPAAEFRRNTGFFHRCPRIAGERGEDRRVATPGYVDHWTHK
jgi:hypothetical protein